MDALYARTKLVVFFKRKTAYEMRISDWSSDVCSSDLSGCGTVLQAASSTLARQAAANGRKFMLISPERGRKRRESGTVFAQCPDQFVQFAPPLCTPGTVSVTPIGETRAERCQPRRDPKSLVSGKMGSVRVALGG